MKTVRVTLTLEELAMLISRIETVVPIDYDLHSFALLRNLYGRFLSLQMKRDPERRMQNES